jgi:hypothetical protein
MPRNGRAWNASRTKFLNQFPTFRTTRNPTTYRFFCVQVNIDLCMLTSLFRNVTANHGDLVSMTCDDVRPGDHIEGEVIELIPSRTKPQGIAKIKWTAYNQRGEPVYTFTPIAIVPRRPT